MNATAGQAEISAPSSPYPVPKAMFAPIVALMPSHSMNRASAGASRPLRASCSSTSEAARMRPSTLSGSRRAAVPSCPWTRPRP